MGMIPCLGNTTATNLLNLHKSADCQHAGEDVFRSQLNRSVKFGKNGGLASPPQEPTAEWRLSDRTGAAPTVSRQSRSRACAVSRDQAPDPAFCS